MKLCKFYDKDNQTTSGGILLDNGDIICGCCGSVIEADDIGITEDCNFAIIEICEEWVNISDEILGIKNW